MALLGTRFLRKNAACLHPWQICCANREHQIPFDTGYCTNSCRDHGITWNYCIRKYVHMPIIYASVLVSKIIKEYQRSTIYGFVNGTPNQFGGLSLFRHQSPMVDHHFPIFLPLKLPSILLDRPLPGGFRAARPRQMTPMRTGEGNDKKIQWK